VVTKIRTLALLALLALPAGAAPRSRAHDSKQCEWVADELPLPLAVKTADDLRLKAATERQYLIFNLLGRGKLSWDKGDYNDAARRWEELLRLPEVDPKLAAELKPFAEAARGRAGGAPALPAVAEQSGANMPAEEKKPEKPASVTVSGQVSGGENGPGGAVVMMRQANGNTPRPPAARGRLMQQKDKSFSPHVLAVPVGSTVGFKNADPIFHNVFSLSPARKFDTGFVKAGTAEGVRFDKPGVVEVLCNIHASMQAWVVVVDTPWYALANASGAFSIKGVPPGEYDVEVWHESASALSKQRITVGDEGAKVALTVGSDKRRNPFPPDKYGKPRQTQLGY
jgi:plastocyanin